MTECVEEPWRVGGGVKVGSAEQVGEGWQPLAGAPHILLWSDTHSESDRP